MLTVYAMTRKLVSRWRGNTNVEGDRVHCSRLMLREEYSLGEESWRQQGEERIHV